MFSIQVDDREDALKPFLEVQTPRRTTDVGVCRLTAGDIGVYWTTPAKHLLMVFERKTWDDLAGSIKDGRIDRQIEDLLKLREDGVAVFLIVEGRLRASHAHIDSWNLTSKLNHIMIRHQIPILYTANQEETVKLVFDMSDSYPMELVDAKVANNVGGADETFDPLVFKRDQNIRNEAFTALGAAPGISYSTAGMLLRHYSIMEMLCGDVIDSLAELQYPVSGGKIERRRACKIVNNLRKRDTHVKMLASVRGITKSVAAKIMDHMPDDISRWDEGTLADCEKTQKRRLGKAAAKKIMTVLSYKVEALQEPPESQESLVSQEPLEPLECEP